MIIINNPNNPTGTMLEKKDVESILELARKKELIVLADEIYDNIIFDGRKHNSFLTCEEDKKNVILVNGFSKTYAMTGWRLGYLVSNEEFADAFMKAVLNTVSCTCSFAQKAAVAALKGPQDDVKRMVEEYEKRRNVIVEELNKIPKVSCVKPQGAFYAFPNVKRIGESRKVAEELLEKKGVALLWGSAFGSRGEGYIRISFATSIERIREGLRRFREYVEEKE